MMNFLAVDDERPARKDLVSALQEAVPECDVHDCATAKAALALAREQPFDVAFLDIELGAVNGILLAKQLKDLQPDLHIIFVTGYAQYAVDAFAIHATGYLLKPIQTEQIQRELSFIYKDAPSALKHVTVRTFGDFEVTVNGRPLHFSRSKAKELLAFLVERRGASVTLREACGVLFEDIPHDRSVKNYFQTILTNLRNTLREAGVEDILVRSYNKLAIDTEKIDCDYYRFLNGDAQAINSYLGEFLPEYSWAEFSTAALTTDRKAYLPADRKAYFSEKHSD